MTVPAVDRVVSLPQLPLEPLNNKGVLDAFVQRAINLATANRLASERYELWSTILKTPSTLALIALLSMSGFAEVLGIDVRNIIILALTIIAALFRGLEKLFNYDAKVAEHDGVAERLEEFADSVMLMARKSSISEEALNKVARQWHHIKCVRIPITFEQKAFEIRHSTYSWLMELRKRQSLTPHETPRVSSAHLPPV
jgi:hypothetical protein